MVVERRISAEDMLALVIGGDRGLTFEDTTVVFTHTDNIAVVELHDEA
jgi:hypothetical protein